MPRQRKTNRASWKWGESLEERFWRRVDKRGPAECWEWQASRNKYGYGQMGGPKGSSTLTRAHRLSWEIANGREVPAGLVVRHKCDNPPCCNPAHLEIGTYADNARDAVERGRFARGSRSGRSRLTEEQVEHAREAARRGVPRAEIAAELGVHKGTVWSATKGWTWRHLDSVTPPVATRIPTMNLDLAREIRRRVAAGEKQSAVARDLGVHFTMVSHVIAGRRYPEPETQTDRKERAA